MDSPLYDPWQHPSLDDVGTSDETQSPRDQDNQDLNENDAAQVVSLTKSDALAASLDSWTFETEKEPVASGSRHFRGVRSAAIFWLVFGLGATLGVLWRMTPSHAAPTSPFEDGNGHIDDNATKTKDIPNITKINADELIKSEEKSPGYTIEINTEAPPKIPLNNANQEDLSNGAPSSQLTIVDFAPFKDNQNLKDSAKDVRDNDEAPNKSIPIKTTSQIQPHTTHAKSTLSLCQTGCSSDDECDPLLICASANSLTKYIEEDCPNLSSSVMVDICIHPRIRESFKGPGGPSELLGRCHGDCDEGHCAEGLTCHQRENPMEMVPTCRGGTMDISKNDYCVPSEYANQKPSSKTKLCNIGCDSDDDCGSMMVCEEVDENSKYVDEDCPELQLSSVAQKVCLHPLIKDSWTGKGAPPTLLERCHGDCDNKSQCGPGLACFQRDSDDTFLVPTCRGGSKITSATDYCVPEQYVSKDDKPPPKPSKLKLCQGICSEDEDCETNLVCESSDAPYVDEDCPDLSSGTEKVCLHPLIQESYGGNEDPGELLQHCHGDCDKSGHCAAGLMCYQREEANEIVPTCRGGKSEEKTIDFCVINSSDDSSSGSRKIAPPPKGLPLCSGDCDEDDDCEFNLVCSRDIEAAYQSGCHDSNGGNTVPVCAYPTLRSFGKTPPRAHFPLRVCTGDCENSGDCGPGLKCLQRESASDPVQGCIGEPDGDTDYCVPSDDDDEDLDVIIPTKPNNDDRSGEITYRPGKLTVQKVQLTLSQGLNARRLATGGRPVLLGDGNWSRRRFHRRPDAAATFPNPDGSGGFVYVSNSEEPGRDEGGVGAIYFDKDGNVLDYQMLLRGTRMNCGGGRTPWGTWITNEEYENGRIWQVEPYGRRAPKVTEIGNDRGWWESFAYDVRDKEKPRFFATEDKGDGALVRFTPSPDAIDWKEEPWEMLHDDRGTVEYLYLMVDEDGDGERGTFTWTKDRDLARGSAGDIYPDTEGIDVREGVMYFVCKKIKMMFTLDLSGRTWTRKSTKNGLFDGGPDQLQRIVGDTRDMLYFTEEQGIEAGIHARDSKGRFYVVAMSEELPGETTGLAFSPDGRFLFVAYQDTDKLFMIWRRDGRPFQAERLDVKFHHVPE